ncbi:hypothetical protein D3C79_996070 [compost metagenome]
MSRVTWHLPYAASIRPAMNQAGRREEHCTIQIGVVGETDTLARQACQVDIELSEQFLTLCQKRR